MHDISLYNFRSISESGIHISEIKQVNLFIGKNNSGKSNILKFIYHLSLALNKKEAFPDGLNDKHYRSSEPTTITLHIDLKFLKFPTTFVTSNQSTNYRRVAIEYNDILGATIDFSMNTSNMESTISNKNYPLSDEASNMLSGHFNVPHHTGTIQETMSRYFNGIASKEFKRLFHDVIYIPEIRFIKEGVEIVPSNSTLKSQNIISELNKMKNPHSGEEQKKVQFTQIVNSIKDLLDIEDLDIEIPYSVSEIILKTGNKRLSLSHYGSGIHELIILCCGILLHPEAIILLEEPELHLHPHLQRKFMKFLLKTKNTYFVSTHSNNFLDMTNKLVSVYHVELESNLSTITLCDTSAKSLSAIQDLGYKASDLLQSNCIIWVEGPSDRYYIQRWFELKDVKFIEGIHYSIMFYGGKLLSHLSLDLDYISNELIPLLKINKNAFVIIDSDKKGSKNTINETKRRIETEIGTDKCWITKGKEVENYLHVDVINKWLASKSIKSTISDTDFDKRISLDDAFDKADVKIEYAKKKVKYSQEIAPFIELAHLKKYDLLQKIDQLQKFIMVSNN